MATIPSEIKFEIHVIPFGGIKAVAVGGKTETHTLESFVRDVIGTGATYTMVHQFTRWPKDIPSRPDLARGVKTPRIKENFISRQELTGDDDRQIDGVVDFWLNDSFFSKYGALFAESSSSKPGAEKGHPVIIFDKPITNIALYEECQRAFIHRYHGKTDKAIKSGERLVYNKPGAKIHKLGNVCPWEVFKAEILIPYRRFVEQQKRAAAVKRVQRPPVATGSHKQKIEQDIVNLANMKKGDDRHGALVSLSVKMGGDLPDTVINACRRNGYYDDHARTDKELRRVWSWGSRLHREPAPAAQPQQAVTTESNPTRLAATATGDLAREVWGDDATMVIPFRAQIPLMTRVSAPDEDTGAGMWPAEPKKTRNAKSLGSVVTVVPHVDHFSAGLADRHDRQWKVCKREWYFRVKREARKALAHAANEPMFYLAGLDVVDVDRLVNRWKMRSKRAGANIVYQVYPYDEGLHAIVTNQDEENTSKVTIPKKGSIPTDRTEVFNLLQLWLDTPEFKTLRRHNQGYGLQFEGMAGDGRMKFLKREMIKAGEGAAALKLEEEYKAARKKLQMVTKMSREKLADKLTAKGYDVVKSRFTFSDLGKFANDIKSICPDLKTRSGNNAWFALQEMQCTPLKHTAKSLKTVCPSRVQEPQKTEVNRLEMAIVEDEIPFTTAEISQYATSFSS